MARRVRSGSSSSTASNLSSSSADSCCSSSSSDSDANPTRVQWGPQRTPEKNWLRRVRKKDSREFVRRQSLGWDRSLRDRLESDQDESSSGADDDNDDDTHAAAMPSSANTSLLEEESSIGGDSQATERPTISPSVTTRRGARNLARVSSLRQDDADSADSDGQDDARETSDDDSRPAGAPVPAVKEEPVEQSIPEVASPVRVAVPSTPARASRPSRSPSPTISPAPVAPSLTSSVVRVKEEPIESTDGIPLGLASAAPGSPAPELPFSDPAPEPALAPTPTLPAAGGYEVDAAAPAENSAASPSVEPSPRSEAELPQSLGTVAQASSVPSTQPEAVLAAAVEEHTPAAETERPAELDVGEKEGEGEGVVDPSEGEETPLKHAPEVAPEQPLALAHNDETPHAEDLATPVDFVPHAVPVTLEEEEDPVVPDEVSFARNVKEEVLSDEEIGDVSTVSAADVIVDEATPPEPLVEAAPCEAHSATSPALEDLLVASSADAPGDLVASSAEVEEAHEEPLQEAVKAESSALPATSASEDALVQDAPVDDAAAEVAPAEEPPFETAPVVPAPLDAAPVEASPVEGAAVENALEVDAPPAADSALEENSSEEDNFVGDDAVSASAVESAAPSITEEVLDASPIDVFVEAQAAPPATSPGATDIPNAGPVDDGEAVSPVEELLVSEREERFEEHASPAEKEGLSIEEDTSPPAATEERSLLQRDEVSSLEEPVDLPSPAPSPRSHAPALNLPSSSPAETTPAAPATPVACPATPPAARPVHAPAEMTPGIRFAPKVTPQPVASSSRLTSTRSSSPRSDSASSTMSTPPANRKAAKPPSPEKVPIARAIRSRIAKATTTADHSSESLIARPLHVSTSVLPTKEPVLPSPITRPPRTLATPSEPVATSRPLRTSRITPPSSRLRAPEPSGSSSTSASSAGAGSASEKRRPLRPTVAVQTPVAPEAAPAAPSAPKRKTLQPTAASQAPVVRAPRARKPVLLPPVAAPSSAAVAQISDAKLQSITQLNTRNNQAYFSPMEKVVVRKEGENRPESPGPKVKKVLPKASLGKGRALFDPPPAEGEDSADDSEADRPTPKKHMRGPGDLEDYESPMKLPRSALKGGRAATLAKGSGLSDGAASASSRPSDEKYSVRWNKGLVLIRSRNSTAPEPQHRARPTGPKPAIKPIPVLDAFGNLEPTVPLTQLIKRSLVTYTQIIYDDDLPPPPAATKKGRK